MLEQPNYYAIIPANVRYADITPNAKLLYGEITALSNQNGYCYAGNEYFANLYNVSKVSVSKWVSELVKNGFIASEITYKEGSKEILNRCLRIVIYPLKENFLPPIKEKFKENNTSIINNTSINNPPIIPPINMGDAKISSKVSANERSKFVERRDESIGENKDGVLSISSSNKECSYGELGLVRLQPSQYSLLEEKYLNLNSAVEALDTWLGKGSKASLSARKSKNHYAYFKSNSWVWGDKGPQIRLKSLETKNNIPMGIRLIDGYWVDLYTDRKLFSVVDNPNPDWNKFNTETRSF